MKDYYDIIGADAAMSREEIKKLYMKKVVSLHPDKVDQQDDGIMLMVEAWKVLGDEERRRQYDAERRRSKVMEENVQYRHVSSVHTTERIVVCSQCGETNEVESGESHVIACVACSMHIDVVHLDMSK